MRMSQAEKDEVRSWYKPSTENVILETYVQDNTVHVKTSSPDGLNHDFKAAETAMFKHNGFGIGLWVEEFSVHGEVWHERGSVVLLVNNDVMQFNSSHLCSGWCTLGGMHPDTFNGVLLSFERFIAHKTLKVYTPSEFDTLCVDYFGLNETQLDTTELTTAVKAWENVFHAQAVKSQQELEFAESRVTATQAFLSKLKLTEEN